MKSTRDGRASRRLMAGTERAACVLVDIGINKEEMIAGADEPTYN